MNHSQDKGKEQQRLHNLKTTLHRISKTAGCRPSSLFGWDDPDDWLERLLFDMEIITNTWQEVNSTNK
jgi:hypothetical protein